jgi:outer membrane receptor protein involved in Fe transport
MHYKIHKTLIISILLILFSSSAFAQTATLKGVIRDQEENDPLIAATVTDANNNGVTSDLDGNYEIILPAGENIITFSYVGYQTITQKVTLQAGEIQLLNIDLSIETNLLQTATVTSGKYEKPLAETTISLEVLKPRLLESTNSTSVDELLNKVPGVTMVGSQPNIRGGSGWSYGAGSRVLLLLDDIPALQADAGLAQWNDIPVENIAQIEVVKGAASALYGSSALNGIINVRTAYATSKPYTKISTFYTMYDDPKDLGKIWWDSLTFNLQDSTYSKESNKFSDQPHEFGVSFAHRQKFKKFDLVLGGFYLNRSSFRKDTYSKYGRISVGTRYRITDNLTIGFNSNFNPGESSSFFLWENGNQGAYRPGGLNPTEALSVSKRFRFTIDPFVNYFDKSGNRHRLTGRLYGVNNKNNGGRSNQSQLYYGEYQFQKKWDKYDVVISSGLVNTFTFVDAELYGDTTYQSRNTAVYLQFDKKFFDKLNISFGARYEQNITNSPEFINSGVIVDTIPNGKISEGKPVFRIGANYQLGKATYLRSSWGQGYRYPTIAEQFIFTSAGGLDILPNPSLESETGWSAELGIKQGFSIGGWNGFIDVAGFWSEYLNMMEFQVHSLSPSFTPRFQSKNIGDTKILGGEISINGAGKIGNLTTYLLAGYTFIKPEYQDFTEEINVQSSVDYNVLKYRNKHSFKFDLEVQYKKFKFGGGYIYNSRMEAIDAVLEFPQFGVKEYRAKNNDGYSNVDARISYEITDKFKIAFISKNILNDEYMVRPGTLEAPRTFTLRGDYKF